MLDLLEEFRPIIDQLVLRVINRRQLAPGDFEVRSGKSLVELLADQPPLGEPTEPGDFVLDQPPPPPSGDPAGQETAPKPATDSPGANASANDTQTPLMGVYLNETGRKVFLVEFFRRLREQLFYPPRSASMELRDIVREQVYHLARVIEGRQPDYLPFIPS